MATETCYVCGKSADRLCDGIISVSTTWTKHDEDAIRTCDRPMCTEHIAHSDDPVFFCKTEDGWPDAQAECDVDSNDYCEQCWTKQRNGVRWKRHGSNVMGLVLMAKGKDALK